MGGLDIASERGQPSASRLKVTTAEPLLIGLHSKANLTKRNFEAMSSTGATAKTLFLYFHSLYFIPTFVALILNLWAIFLTL